MSMKKAYVMALIMISLVIVSIQPIKAQHQGNIAIKSDGSISPSTAPIQQTSNTYTLENDIQGDVVIEANNIILDGKGHNLIGQIFLVQIANVTVKNFIITETGKQLLGPTVGILLNDTSNSLIINNTITGIASVQAWNWAPYAGISVFRGNSNTISQNNLDFNLEGLLFIYTTNNLVKENNITTYPSIYLYTTGISFTNASNNYIYHNNFVNATYQAQSVNSTNLWDNGYPSGGNYWDDYKTRYPNASTIDNSGIGNTPYFVDQQNKDNYPFMEPFHNIPAETPNPSPQNSIIPTKETFPTGEEATVLAISAVTIVVIVSLAVYFKKRRH
jgi:nitrous oxidase accessory protein NosD